MNRSSKHATRYRQDLITTALKDAAEAEQLGLPLRVDLELRKALSAALKLGNKPLCKHIAGRLTLLWMQRGCQ